MKRSSHSRAFTLIELLVVISIIGLLASIIVAMFAGAKVKANDAKKMATAKMVNTAIQMDFLNFSSLPGNYLRRDGTYVGDYAQSLSASESQPAYESTTNNASNQAYQRSMQDLIARGTYSVIPTSLDGNSYGYFNDDRPEGVGAIFSARLSNNTTSTGGSGTNVGIKPNPPSVTANDTANTVTGMATGMEYKLSTASTYTTYSPSTFVNSFPGNLTLLVRIAASGINPASDDVTLTFLENIVQPPVIPPFSYTIQIIFDRDATPTDSVTGTAYGQPLVFLTGWWPNEQSRPSCANRSCTAAVPPGTVTLTRSTGQDKYFIGWSGPCSGRGTTCTFDSYSSTGMLDVTLTYRYTP